MVQTGVDFRNDPLRKSSSEFSCDAKQRLPVIVSTWSIASAGEVCQEATRIHYAVWQRGGDMVPYRARSSRRASCQLSDT